MDRDDEPPRIDVRPIDLDLDRRETVEFGGSGPRRPVPAAVKWLAGIALFVAAVIFYTHRSSSPPPVVAPSVEPTSIASQQPYRVSDAPVVTKVGYKLLGETGRWELFGWSNGMVVRIQPSLGQYTVTPVPPLESGAPSTLIAASTSALVFSYDNVPGYAVPDGEKARILPRDVHPNGAPLTGPDPDHLWILDQSGRHARLQTTSGKSAGVTMTLPSDADVNGEFPDGSGYLLVQTPHGTYDVRPHRTTHVTTGHVLAAGPTGWLVIECGKPDNCMSTMVSRSNGARRTVGPFRYLTGGSVGVVSPNGKYAGVLALNGDGSGDVDLVNLTTGRSHLMNISVAADNADAMAWSPDSRWLFAADGNLVPINAATGTTVTMNNAWEITDLAIRP
ncbi:MAG TPA: WD40 repeat domain-containing protein [Micromonosporaceae bacterium]|jgi:hypothetical protein